MTNEEAIKELSVLWERMNRAKESGVLAYKTIMYYDGQYVEALDTAIKALEQQPKTGHWIDIMVGDMPAQACDQCNTFYPLAYTGGGHKHCPNCGADMRERTDKE